MKILSNVELTKLREYSRSYGAPETMTIPFVKEYENEIHLLNKVGDTTRIMKKGTKLLIDFSGNEISERAFKIRTTNAKKEQLKEAEERAAIEAENIARINKIKAVQLAKWEDLLATNPEKVAKYKSKIKSLPSAKWRNLLRLKAVKHINDGRFGDLEVSASELRDILYKF